MKVNNPALAIRTPMLKFALKSHRTRMHYLQVCRWPGMGLLLQSVAADTGPDIPTPKQNNQLQLQSVSIMSLMKK